MKTTLGRKADDKRMSGEPNRLTSGEDGLQDATLASQTFPQTRPLSGNLCQRDRKLSRRELSGIADVFVSGSTSGGVEGSSGNSRRLKAPSSQTREWDGTCFIGPSLKGMIMAARRDPSIRKD
jgi:hypothetical protein